MLINESSAYMSATPPQKGSSAPRVNPLNLALAFALELMMLGALIYWGWTQHEGIVRVLLTVGLPLLAAVLWGVFRVDNDPNKAVVVVPGVLRLLLEWGLFALAALLLASTGATTTALIFAVLVVINYAFSLNYLRWKIAQK